MQVGQISPNGKVAFTKGKYYITGLTRECDGLILYRVFIDDNYWRNQKQAKFASVYLDHCIDWINKRRCFNKVGD